MHRQLMLLLCAPPADAGPSVSHQLMREPLCAGVPVTWSGLLNAVVWTWEVALDETTSLTNAPRAPHTHWRQAVQLFPNARLRSVQAGQAVDVTATPLGGRELRFDLTAGDTRSARPPKATRPHAPWVERHPPAETLPVGSQLVGGCAPPDNGGGGVDVKPAHLHGGSGGVDVRPSPDAPAWPTPPVQTAYLRPAHMRRRLRCGDRAEAERPEQGEGSADASSRQCALPNLPEHTRRVFAAGGGGAIPSASAPPPRRRPGMVCASTGVLPVEWLCFRARKPRAAVPGTRVSTDECWLSEMASCTKHVDEFGLNPQSSFDSVQCCDAVLDIAAAPGQLGVDPLDAYQGVRLFYAS